MRAKKILLSVLCIIIVLSVSFAFGDNVIRGIFWGDIKGDITRQADIQAMKTALEGYSIEYGGAGTNAVTGPASTTENYVTGWDAVTRKLKSIYAHAKTAIANTFAVRDESGNIYANRFYDIDGQIGASAAQSAAMSVAFYDVDVTLNAALDKTIISNRNATSDIVINMNQLGSGAGKLNDGFEFGVVNEVGLTGYNTSYSNAGGSGNRGSLITMTTSLAYGWGDLLNQFIDGSTGNTGTWVGGNSVVGQHITFQFTEPKCIQEVTSIWDNAGGGFATDSSTWQWQGSSNGTNWTNIGAQWTGNGQATCVDTSMSGNLNLYTYYRLYGISGVTGTQNYAKEIEFKIASASGVVDTIITLTPDQTTPDQLPLTAAAGSSLQFSHKNDFMWFQVIDGKIICKSVFPAASNITDLMD